MVPIAAAFSLRARPGAPAGGAAPPAPARAAAASSSASVASMNAVSALLHCLSALVHGSRPPHLAPSFASAHTRAARAHLARELALSLARAGP